MDETKEIYLPWVTIAIKIGGLQKILKGGDIEDPLLEMVTITDAEKGIMKPTNDFEEKYGGSNRRVEAYYAYIRDLEKLMQDLN